MRRYLEECRKIEMTMGEVYGRLAGAEICNASLREMFRQLARDETRHAEQFEIAKSVPSDVFYREMAVPPAQVERLLRRLSRLLRTAQHPPRSASRVIELLREAEAAIMDIHLSNASRFTETDFADLFREISRETGEHLDILDACQSRAAPRQMRAAG